MRDRRFKRPMEAGNVVGDRVGLLTVAGRGVGEAQRVEWDVGCRDGRVEVAKWLRLSGRAAGPAPSVVVLVGHRLVEYEHGDWFGLGGIEGRSLVEEEVSLRRRAVPERRVDEHSSGAAVRRWLGPHPRCGRTHRC